MHMRSLIATIFRWNSTEKENLKIDFWALEFERPNRYTGIPNGLNTSLWDTPLTVWNLATATTLRLTQSKKNCLFLYQISRNGLKWQSWCNSHGEVVGESFPIVCSNSFFSCRRTGREWTWYKLFENVRSWFRIVIMSFHNFSKSQDLLTINCK